MALTPARPRLASVAHRWARRAACALAIVTSVGGCASQPGVGQDAAPSSTAPPSASASAATSAAPSGSAMPCGRRAPGGPAFTVNGGELPPAVRHVAVERTPGTPGHAAVRESLVRELTSFGYDVLRPQSSSVANVVARKKGRERPEEIVVLSAHYDHIPGCPGADDNASGVVAVMTAARALAKQDFARTLDVAFWDHEEDGLHGSAAYASAAAQAKENIVVAISLDAVGFASSRPGSQSLPPGFATMFPDVDAQLRARDYAADFITFIGDDGAGANEAVAVLRARADQVELPSVGLNLSVLRRVILNDVARSDHASFWLRGYSGVLVTDTANFRNPGYHCMVTVDRPDTLDYTFLDRVAETVVGATNDLLQPIATPRP